MSKGRPKRMFSLSPVDFRNSPIEGRGVFAKKRFAPGEVVVPYAHKQRKVEMSHPDAEAAAATKLTLLSEGRFVIIPDTSMPGGWLCNHSCSPNAAIFSDGEGRIQCIRAIEPGQEVTVFYGWVTENNAVGVPCLCGSPNCRGLVNFDITDDDVRRIEIQDGALVTKDDALRAKLEAYGEFLRAIQQEQVQRTIANTIASMKR